jgi:hypothetical protein
MSKEKTKWLTMIPLMLCLVQAFGCSFPLLTNGAIMGNENVFQVHCGLFEESGVGPYFMLGYNMSSSHVQIECSGFRRAISCSQNFKMETYESTYRVDTDRNRAYITTPGFNQSAVWVKFYCKDQ